MVGGKRTLVVAVAVVVVVVVVVVGLVKGLKVDCCYRDGLG